MTFRLMTMFSSLATTGIKEGIPYCHEVVNNLYRAEHNRKKNGKKYLLLSCPGAYVTAVVVRQLDCFSRFPCKVSDIFAL